MLMTRSAKTSDKALRDNQHPHPPTPTPPRGLTFHLFAVKAQIIGGLVAREI